MGLHNPKIKSIHDSLDRLSFTVRWRIIKYLDTVIDCSQVFGMYSKEVDFSMVADKLTQVLELAVLLFSGSFTITAGSLEKYASKLMPVSL